MQIYRIVVAGLAVALSGMIWWAFTDRSISTSFAMIVDDPWGLVALADLYLGFILLSSIIWLFESSRLQALLWIVPLYLLGNAWSAAWMVWRLPDLAARLRARE